jgi:hypothetical protein
LSHILHRYCLLGLFLDEDEAAVSGIIISIMFGLHICFNIRFKVVLTYSSETNKRTKIQNTLALLLLLDSDESFIVVSDLFQRRGNGEEQEKIKGTPLYGANLVLPMTDLANPIIQIHYKIGTRIYIKNAI